MSTPLGESWLDDAKGALTEGGAFDLAYAQAAALIAIAETLERMVNTLAQLNAIMIEVQR